MKNKVILLCAVVAIALGLYLIHDRELLKRALTSKDFETNASTSSESIQQNIVTKQANANPGQAAQSKSQNELTVEEKNTEIRNTLEAQNKPIELWGKVVDQDGVPLPDVKVESEINHFTWPPEQHPNGTSTKQELKTDANGQFFVRDDSATGVHITLKKDGYEQESPNGYGSSSGGGSKGSPVILKMWDVKIHEPLITGEKKSQIIPDGRSYVIDLTKGTIAESGEGDLKVWVKRPDQIAFGQQYGWSCEMDVVNGGVLAATDAPMYLAPTDEYTPSFQFEQKVGSGWGDTTGPRRFYIKLDNGHVYGRITIELMAYYNDRVPGMIRLSYAINPSGSRILR